MSSSPQFSPFLKSVFTIIFLYVAVGSFAQTSQDYKSNKDFQEDSVLKVIKQVSDSVKVEIYTKLLGNALLVNPNQAEKWYQDGIFYAEKMGSTDAIMRLKVLRMVALNRTSQHAKILEEAPKLEKDLQNVKRQRTVFAFYLEWATANLKTASYLDAITLYKKVIELAKQHDQLDVELLALNNFGSTYNEMKRWADAKDIFKRVIELSREKNMRTEEAMGTFNFALAESMMGNYGKAIDHYKQSLVIFDSLHNVYGVGLCYANLSSNYFKIKKYNQALPLARKAYAVQKSLNQIGGYAKVRRTMAQVFAETGEVDSALVAIGESIHLFDSLKALSDLQECYEIKAGLLAQKNDFANAFQALKKNEVLKDSVVKQSADKQLQQQMLIVKANYTDSLTLAKQAEMTSAKSSRNLLAIATILLLMTSIVLFVRSRKKNPATTELHKASERIRSLETELLTVKTQLDQQVKFQWSELQGRLAKEGDWSESYWNEFLLVFTRTYPDFFAKLKEQFPDLSQHELRICALVKLNLTQQDMVDILNISVESVRKARYRIYKKMGLGSDQELVDSLLKY